MVSQERSCNFSFAGRHCDDFGVCFLPSAWPFVPEQTVPQLTVPGRHGTLRYPGRTLGVRRFAGTLYLLDERGDTAPIPLAETLRRASALSNWLIGQDGRAPLILDALDDRYYVAELDAAESALTDEGWENGCAELTFLCQPFAHARREENARLSCAANQAAKTALSVPGNVQTPLAFSVTSDGGTVSALTVEAPNTRFTFSGLGLAAGETLRASYTQDDLLRLIIEGVDGAERSAMPARQTESDDDLLLTPGRNEIAVKADRACTVQLRARGRWL